MKSGEPPLVASQAAVILNVNPPSFGGHTGSKGSRFVKTMSGVMHHKIPSDSRYNAPSNEDFNLRESSEEEVNDDQAPPVQDVVMISQGYTDP
jgi:energy-coupling factor transporter ATP-binding protein EcfA2